MKLKTLTWVILVVVAVATSSTATNALEDIALTKQNNLKDQNVNANDGYRKDHTLVEETSQPVDLDDIQVVDEKKTAIVELESPDELKRMVLEMQDTPASSLLQPQPSNQVPPLLPVENITPQSIPPVEKVSNVTVSGFNYAAMDAGAVIMASNSEAQGVSNLLISDPDKYSLSPCSAQQWFVVSLSEEILLTTVEVTNLERYSSSARKFQLLASHKFPAEEWNVLGEFERPSHRGTESFTVIRPLWARYVKFMVQNIHGNEVYCTLSKIRVFGQTALETLREDLALSQQHLEAVRTSITDHQLNSLTSSSNGNDEPCAPDGSDVSLEPSIPVDQAEQLIPLVNETETVEQPQDATINALTLSLVNGKSALMDNIFKTLMEKVKEVEIDVSVLKACLETNNDKVKTALEFLDKTLRELKEDVTAMQSRSHEEDKDVDRLKVLEDMIESVSRRQQTYEVLGFLILSIVFWLLLRV